MGYQNIRERVVWLIMVWNKYAIHIKLWPRISESYIGMVETHKKVLDDAEVLRVPY